MVVSAVMNNVTYYTILSCVNQKKFRHFLFSCNLYSTCTCTERDVTNNTMDQTIYIIHIWTCVVLDTLNYLT